MNTPDFPLTMAAQNYMPVLFSALGRADHQHDLERGVCVGGVDGDAPTCRESIEGDNGDGCSSRLSVT